MSIPVKKNDDITLEITSMNAEGAGVGRFEGFTVFVPFALPGETVKAHVVKVTKSYAAAKLLAVDIVSEDRVAPLCPLYGRCGGCSLQHMSYPAQLEYKRSRVASALERIGGFKEIRVSATIPSTNTLRCRNKAGFPFGSKDGRVVWGLYAPRSHRLIEAADCPIEKNEAVIAANAIAEWANENGIAAYSEDTGEGLLRHVVTRIASHGVSVCAVSSGELPCKEELITKLISSVPHLRSVVNNINPDNTNVIMGPVNRVIWGDESVLHNICGLDYSVSCESFLQVNTDQTEKLYSLAIEGLGLDKSMNVADVFCGIGTITLLLAKRAAHAVGIEYVPRAIENAKENSRMNGVTNADFICGPAEKVLPRLVAEGKRFDALVLDPPRKGADPAVLDAIAASGAKRIAYISCDPATLARDLKILSEKGYLIGSVTPVDMFPMTAHIETVTLITRVG